MMVDKLRMLQLKELEILTSVLQICEQYSLRVYAIGGTALGAVRHKGFIPWDDDIDLAMPRDDYEKFIEIAPAQLPDRYKILRNAGKLKFLYIKIHDVTTTFIEDNCIDHQEWYKGVFIDIMPLDGMPSQQKQRILYCKAINMLSKIYSYQRFSFRECKTWKSKAVFLIPRTFIYAIWEKIVTKYDFNKSMYTSFTWTNRAETWMFPCNLFENVKYMQFETIKIPLPVGYETYLKIHYGDYLQLPPEKDRIAHSMGNAIIHTNTPYKCFYKK